MIVLNPIVGLPEPLLLGLHALGELVKEPDRCRTTQEIAAIIGTSEPHLSKVLQRLNKGGIIKSVRGPGGGYKLNCVPEETPLYPVFELLGGPFESRGCSLEGCANKRCFIGDMMDELSRAVFRYLASRTLADFKSYYEKGTNVSIEISVITPSLGQKHPNFGHEI
ncbi:MAG: Rrf2 family transcriptional regulator [Synergistes sp.]|nr:Rrf2 family transcriptional regulator [Synergistes sp.]